ncbi:MAG: lysozyme [Parvularculaceae bacterium]
MKISDNGLALIKRFEGFEPESYQDIAGVWTIGYGHTGPEVGPDQKISQKEADALLERDLQTFENAVDRAVKVPLNQNEFDALVSFAYNVGAGALRSSTALKRLNRGDRLGAADALTWWNKATVAGVLREVAGLTRRRAAEKALFLTPVNPPIVADPKQLSENSRITPVEDSPRRDSVGESRTVQGAAVAGAAGAAASTVGKQSADDLTNLETNIETGAGNTETPATNTGDTATDGGSTQSGGDTGTAATGDGASETGTTSTGDTGSTTATGENAASGGDTSAAGGDGSTTDSGAGSASGDQTTTMSIPTTPEHPSAHERHAVDAQLQLALLIIIVLAVLYVIFARVDDWLHYRR